MLVTRASTIKRAVDKLCKEYTDMSRTAVRNMVSRNIGHKMLYKMLDDIDVLSSETRELMDFNTLTKRVKIDHPINPSYMYKKYKFEKFPKMYAPDMTDKYIKSQIYEQSQVLDAVNYASQKSRSGIANRLLLNIFNPAVANCVAAQISISSATYKIFTAQWPKILDPVANAVYRRRKKWITGLTAKSIKMKFKFFDAGASEYAKSSKKETGIYIEMRADYRTPGRRVNYYKDMMDRGAYSSGDIPDLPAIYGWIKRRQAAGVWRPLIVTNYRRYDSKMGKLSKISHDIKEASPGLAAYMIAKRMQKMFESTGKLYPFGNMDKYSVPRRKFYGTQIHHFEGPNMKWDDTVESYSIFTEIMMETLRIIHGYAMRANSEIEVPVIGTDTFQTDNHLEFKHRLMRAITAIEDNRESKELRSAIASLNAYVDYHNVRKKIKLDDYIIGAGGSKAFTKNELNGMKLLAKSLGIVIKI